ATWRKVNDDAESIKRLRTDLSLFAHVRSFLIPRRMYIIESRPSRNIRRWKEACVEPNIRNRAGSGSGAFPGGSGAFDQSTYRSGAEPCEWSVRYGSRHKFRCG